MKKVVAIYHKDCSDGTAAAAVVLKKFPGSKVFPLYHSYTKEDLDPILTLIDSDTDIYTVDCVMGVKEILEMGFKVVSIDHHIGIKDEFENIARENPNYTFIFDNDKSGSSLSWQYLFPDKEMPQLIKYIEDVDLWRWRYEETKYVVNYFSIFNNQPEKFLEYFDKDLTQAIEFGKNVEVYREEKLRQYSEIKPIKLKIGENVVLAFNIVDSKSDMGHIFSIATQQAVLMYSIDGDFVKLSFRAEQDYKPSPLELATILGGGGHDRAAGGKIPLKKFIEMIVFES